MSKNKSNNYTRVETPKGSLTGLRPSLLGGFPPQAKLASENTPIYAVPLRRTVYITTNYRVKSEYSDSSKEEIQNQLEEPNRHSGKEATEIYPKTEKMVNSQINITYTNTHTNTRERLNATIIYGKSVALSTISDKS